MGVCTHVALETVNAGPLCGCQQAALIMPRLSLSVSPRHPGGGVVLSVRGDHPRAAALLVPGRPVPGLGACHEQLGAHGADRGARRLEDQHGLCGPQEGCHRSGACVCVCVCVCGCQVKSSQVSFIYRAHLQQPKADQSASQIKVQVQIHYYKSKTSNTKCSKNRK